MADDDRLLEILARALDPGDPQPPADRIAQLRIQAAARQKREPAQPAAEVPSDTRVQEDLTPPPPPVPLPATSEGASVSPIRRKPTRVVAGLALAAAAVVVALVAAPAVLRERGGETSVASGESVANARQAVSRLRAALLSRDPLTVARADAELVRLTRQLPPAERALVESEAVQARLQAIQFLRDHPTPEVLAVVPAGPGATPAPATTAPSGPAVVPTTVAPGAGPVATTPPPPPPVPTTVAVPNPSVTITSVRPTLDGTFAVDFTVSGFTPDRSRRPGSLAVRFSFDGGEKPEVWTGPSPWTFPTDNAIRYKQVCAAVIDAHRGDETGSGNCVNIS